MRGGKWGVSFEDESQKTNRVYVLLHYGNFDDPKTTPASFVIPAPDAEAMKEPWFQGRAIYCSNKACRAALEPYRDRWDLV